MVIKILFVIFVGLAGGIAVGSGFVAFLAVLGIIPRLTQLTKTMKMIIWYQWAVVAGALIGGMGSLRDPAIFFPSLTLIPLGLAGGIFVGAMAAALTEVLNVFPILAKRIGIEDKIVVLMMAFVFGKIFGSLYQWLYLVGR
ncbi:stage V sporulation protein AB [Robertmurraya andreesenii]|uniref:Stage V sporulation protein AB n=1 Tax=Anoxybacillus andreesenii TaxID=1325932 RepID=A0ABT9V8G1_9BACL|nr:stage V sporulation protein AB [Robertmurraya andreesenii]MDQ0157229.1 stage V sporulation protein AB [Robertmurraya andreesenii]